MRKADANGLVDRVDAIDSGLIGVTIRSTHGPNDHEPCFQGLGEKEPWPMFSSIWYGWEGPHLSSRGLFETAAGLQAWNDKACG